MTKQELIVHLSGPASVDFTFMPVGKVIELIEELDETPSPSALTETDIKELVEDIVAEVAGEDMNLIEDYELSMNYREVELDSVTIDEEVVRREVGRAVKAFFEDRGERDID